MEGNWTSELILLLDELPDFKTLVEWAKAHSFTSEDAQWAFSALGPSDKARVHAWARQIAKNGHPRGGFIRGVVLDYVQHTVSDAVLGGQFDREVERVVPLVVLAAARPQDILRTLKRFSHGVSSRETAREPVLECTPKHDASVATFQPAAAMVQALKAQDWPQVVAIAKRHGRPSQELRDGRAWLTFHVTDDNGYQVVLEFVSAGPAPAFRTSDLEKVRVRMSGERRIALLSTDLGDLMFS